MTQRRITAARGGQPRCRGWRQEGLLRMLENVLEVGERPEDLVVYAALGKAARDWGSFDAIVAALTTMTEDQTLVLQSGRPVGLFRTGPDAPLVVSAVNNMVGSWQTADRFYRLMADGMTMWGGLTAGAWQYIGRQGVLQGTYELLRCVSEEHFAGDYRGRWLLTSGLGGMGSAQPLAARLAGVTSLTVEADPAKVAKARAAGLLRAAVTTLDDALAEVDRAREAGEPAAVALHGNAAEVYPELVARGITPDVVTDLTAAHDLRYGYAPPGLSMDDWRALRGSEPERVEQLALRGITGEVRAMLAFQARGAVVFENGNNIRTHARAGGVAEAFEISGFMERYLRPLFCQGIGPFRWVALSGDPADIEKIDALVPTLVPERPEVAHWLALAGAHVPPQGLPARSCWLGHRERARVAVAVNELVAAGQLAAPVLFTRDHLDAAGMTHPGIGTEQMRDGSDGISDWPILDALLLCSAGADLVAVHAGGGGYTGHMQSAGVSIVANGTPSAQVRLARGLNADTGLGVMRYAAAGYETATKIAAGEDWIDPRMWSRTCES
ncbi:MAG TPA: urocanate hydratase [Pseudonocardia sp.]|uniref:urocanate hydratase n=1 Tax=Pseudonocardia sp. TaxID=60912 RepID=UPI002EDA393B